MADLVVSLTIPETHVASVIAAMERMHPREDGLTDAAYMRGIIDGWIRDHYKQHKVRQTVVNVPGDLTDVTP